MMLNFVVIANPENRRVGLLQQALFNFDLAPATVVAYADLIAGKETLERFNAPNTIIRFESPEKNFRVEKAIIAAGAEVPDAGNQQRINASATAELTFDKGRILYPRQWYLGWRYLLHRWEKQLQCPTMNHPHDITVMFDKPLCCDRFLRHNIPVPRSIGVIYNYDHLREQMELQKCDRVFIKLAHSSAASGIVAYRTNSHRESAITTVERVRQGGQTFLYNSRKIRHYTKREEIADIINLLTAEGVQVEEWLPKAQMQGCQFDVRVVVINGEAQHIVIRLGKSPMTNLHLGNERGDTEEFLAKVGYENWEVMKQTCQAAAALFPNSLYCGIDLLILPNFRNHVILEINAFGDLLPGITWNGIDTYTSEVRAVLKGEKCLT
ncbi:STM4014 family protein [Dendronalium sp. ChiSLP03b]|uniref:STM4014 family protein n=1 Tax=Dendronalium sp. ChiSLP03b TaxID=3075381 RepID=UPI002AD4694C|nr:STM4014 family protein [Dendronalium sp. ChiSLP03b]MDZ8209081.1 STM4014 family protein [Dendronalium sp. ChiSLP03b]